MTPAAPPTMRRRPWTAAEDAVMRERYPVERGADLALALGRTPAAVFGRAKTLGLVKSAAFLASDRSGRIQRGRTHPGMVATQMKKGHTPWNKGIKGSAGLHPNSRRTHFEKGVLRGRAAQVVQPIGAERVSKDGILQRKVNNDLPFQRRWRSVHSLVWEAAHGPVPKGHKVIFRPGQHATVAALITPEKLELVTFAELMRRNSYHTRYPKEVGQLIQLRGALNGKINRAARQEAEREK